MKTTSIKHKQSANTNSNKLLELKKYYAECAEKYLFENKKALKSFQDIMISIVKKKN